MAMAMRAAAAAGPGGLSLRGLLFSTLTSTSPFIPPPTNQDPPPTSSSLGLANVLLQKDFKMPLQGLVMWSMLVLEWCGD
ncbi:hypothetical protein CsSME_00026307 [Camellia sinensis var. sinensis]